MSEKRKKGYTPKELGEELAKKRIALPGNIRQADIAKKVGLNESTINRLERGRIQTIPADKISALAKAYGVSEDILKPSAKLRLSGYQHEKPLDVLPIIKVLANNANNGETAIKCLSHQDFNRLVIALKGLGCKPSEQTVLSILNDIKSSRKR